MDFCHFYQTDKGKQSVKMAYFVLSKRGAKKSVDPEGYIYTCKKKEEHKFY